MFKRLFGRKNNVDPRDLENNRLKIRIAELKAELEEARQDRDYYASYVEDVATDSVRRVKGAYFGGQRS